MTMSLFCLLDRFTKSKLIQPQNMLKRLEANMYGQTTYESVKTEEYFSSIE